MIAEIAKSNAKDEAAAKRHIDGKLSQKDEVNSVNYRYSREQIDAQLKIHKEQTEQGKSLPLAGICFAIKDNICTEGIPTSCGSAFLKDYKPPYTATVVKNLMSAGAVAIAKANCDEFAMGSYNDNSIYGQVLNPHDHSCVAGGSSGGSAAAVASGLCDFSLGSDTGGSVRQPASFCGVVGFKPTYGSISRYGLVAYASSLDQIGIIAKSVADVESVFAVAKSDDIMDSTSFPESDSNATDVSHTVKVAGKKVGYFSKILEHAQPAVKDDFLNNIKKLKDSGADVVCLDKQDSCLDYLAPCYYLICTAEASSNLSRFDGVRFGHRAGDYKNIEELISRSRRDGFSQEVKQRIMLGTFALASGYYDQYYQKAVMLRMRISEYMDEVFQSIDFLASPTYPSPAPKISELSDGSYDRVKTYASDEFTVLANLTGCPALSIPCGWAHGDGPKAMPLGMQFMGKKHNDSRLLSYCRQISESKIITM